MTRQSHLLSVTTAVCLLIVMSAPAEAQSVTEVKAHQQLNLDRSRAIEAAPGASASYALPVPEISLLATKDGGEATAVIGRSDPFWGVRATFKTPIGKESSAEANPLSLSGLANQATIDLSVIRKRIFKNANNIDQLRLAFCAERSIPNNKCSDQAFTGVDREQFLDFGIHRVPIIATARVQVGGKSFDYVDRASAEKHSEKKTSVLGGASIGWLFLNSQSILAIAVDGAHDYAASRDTTLLCQPLGTQVQDIDRCDTRTIGAPAASDTVTFSVDVRKVFVRDQLNPAKPAEGGKPPVPADVPIQSVPVVGVGLQMRVRAVEDSDSLWSIEMPVHFLQRKPEKGSLMSLNGGASAGWNSRTGFTARVFIGPSFGLIGNDIQ